MHVDTFPLGDWSILVSYIFLSLFFEMLPFTLVALLYLSTTEKMMNKIEGEMKINPILTAL